MPTAERSRANLVKFGRRTTVGGQDDMIVDVAPPILKARNA
jgi:hypothetical protein